jgi:hypothetical protein
MTGETYTRRRRRRVANIAGRYIVNDPDPWHPLTRRPEHGRVENWHGQRQAETKS